MYIKLKKLRNSHKYTTKNMADKLKISKPYYCQIENKKRNLSYRLAYGIAKIFDMKPDEIFYDDFEIRK